MDRKKRVIAIGAVGPDFDQTPDPFGIHYSDQILKQDGGDRAKR